MTIIVTDGNVVAADTLVSRGYQEIVGGARKIFPLRKGKRIVVAGFAGTAWGFAPCLQWWLRGAKPKDFPGEFKDTNGAFILFEYGQAPLRFSDTSCGWPVAQRKEYADGVGDDFAFALVRQGMSAISVAEEVCKISSGCRPPVEAFSLRTTEWLTKMDHAPNEAMMKELIEAEKGWKVI